MHSCHSCAQSTKNVTERCNCTTSVSHSTCSLQSSYKHLWNKKSHWMHSSYWHHPSQMAATLRTHCKVWTWNGSPSCSTCRNSRTACWLETTSRATKTDMDSNYWERSEICQYWSAHRVLTGGTSCRQQRSTRGMLLMIMTLNYSVASVVYSLSLFLSGATAWFIVFLSFRWR